MTKFVYFLLILAVCSIDVEEIKQKIDALQSETSKLVAQLAEVEKKTDKQSSVTLRGERNIFKIGNNSSKYLFEMLDGAFSIGNPEPIIHFNEKDLAIAKLDATKGIHLNGSEFKINGVPQWRLVMHETFEKEAAGWSDNKTYKCAGIHMLGGFCNTSTQPLIKKFEKLPRHSSVRIVFNYHYLDSWDGSSGYLKAVIADKSQYLWVNSFENKGSTESINICGGHWPETKLSEKVDVSFAHVSDILTVEIGSTLKFDPCNESYGISDFRIYLK